MRLDAAVILALGVAASASSGRQWTPTTPLPDGWMNHQVVSTSNHVYHLGGQSMSIGVPDGYRVFHAAIMASGGLGSWTEDESLPSAVWFGHVAAIWDDVIYVVGGFRWDADPNKIAISDRVYFARLNADGSIGSWQETTALPQVTYLHGAATSNGRLYVAGGSNGTTLYDTVLSASIHGDGTLGPWRAEVPLPQPVYIHTMVAAGGSLYTIGGWVGPSTLLSDCDLREYWR
jgi:hypothetical protein